MDYRGRYCIIGAGAAGITSAKNLKAFGIPFDVLEREDEVGGNWYFGHPNSSVYASTHLLSSKPLTAFTDFPMPEDYPDFPHHHQVLAYLRAYARHFNLYEHIQFHTSVERLEKSADGWDVRLSSGETRRYRGVIIANGHHWDPNFPDFPGGFKGDTLHTKYYKTPDVLRSKRVLVIGAGNSGCDLVVEAVHHAEKVFHSTRRSYYYIPKFILGKPVDQIDQTFRPLRMPVFLRRWSNLLLVRLALGLPQDYGLPRPDHKFLETHPIVNSQMLYHLGHGDILPKPNVEMLCGDRVRFVDGSEEAVDLIIYATGFKISFPFIDKQHLNWQGAGPALYLHVFHPQYDDLFVVGLLQPDSGIFWLMDYQAQLIARFLHAQQHAPQKAAGFKRIKAGPQPDMRGGVRHLMTDRHFLEINHYSYKRLITRLIRRFDL